MGTAPIKVLNYYIFTLSTFWRLPAASFVSPFFLFRSQCLVRWPLPGRMIIVYANCVCRHLRWERAMRWWSCASQPRGLTCSCCHLCTLAVSSNLSATLLVPPAICCTTVTHTHSWRYVCVPATNCSQEIAVWRWFCKSTYTFILFCIKIKFNVTY